MARGNVKGPFGPLMLALLLGLAAFMLYAVNNPEMADWFDRPDGFYDNTLKKVSFALLVAMVVSAIGPNAGIRIRTPISISRFGRISSFHP